MSIYKGRYVLGLLLAIVLLMSACGSTGSTGGGGSQTPTPSPTPSPQTPSQVLQSSATAEKQLKSAHIETKLIEAVQSNFPSTGVPSGNISVNINVNGSGDEVFPDKASLKVSLTEMSSVGTAVPSTNIAEVIDGSKIYIQSSKGQWYVLDKSALAGGSNSPLSQGNAPNAAMLLALAQNAQLTDHGNETLNGQSLRHITATLDQNSLVQLFGQSGLLNSLPAAAKALLGSAKIANSSLDFWIDPSTSYVQREEIKLNLSLNLGNLLPSTPTPGAAGIGVSISLDSTTDFSKFNDPSIMITDPPNAIPTNTLPPGIFGGH